MFYEQLWCLISYNPSLLEIKFAVLDDTQSLIFFFVEQKLNLVVAKPKFLLQSRNQAPKQKILVSKFVRGTNNSMAYTGNYNLKASNASIIM